MSTQAGESGNPSGAGIYRTYEDDRNASSEETVYTSSNGVAVPHPYETQRVGINGPLLLQDFHLIDLISHFDRERIPERVVHAKGSGAHGTFKCTNPMDDLCMANIFSKEGQTCPLTVRFSTVGGESGSHDCKYFSKLYLLFAAHLGLGTKFGLPIVSVIHAKDQDGH